MAPHIRRLKGRGSSYYLIDGRKAKSLKTPVKRYAEALLADYQRGKLGLKRHEPTWQEYYEKWIKTKAGALIRKSLRVSYMQHFKSYVLPEFGQNTLSSLKTSGLSAFRAKLLARGLSVKTARNILDGSMRALWRDATGEEIVTKNPFALVQWPIAERKLPDPFGAAEKAAILNYVREHQPFYYPFVFAQFETGMRPSETAALRFADIDLSAGTVTISKSRNMGAESKPKTRASWRTISVSNDIIELIQAMRLPWHDDHAHVFYNKISGRPLDANQWARVYWKTMLAGAGVPYRKFYSTRHTFITEAIRNGGNPYAVAQYCGTSLAMIEANYCGKVELSGMVKVRRESSKLLSSQMVPTGIEPNRELLNNIKQVVNSQGSKWRLA